MTAAPQSCQPEADGPRHAPVTELHKQGSAMFLCWPTNAIDLAKNDSDLPELVDKLAQFIANWEAKGAKAREWQPIETAPKDEKWVLVWERYINTKYHPAEVARYRDGKWRNSANKIVDVVTHWMPLPASPVVPLDKSGGAT